MSKSKQKITNGAEAFNAYYKSVYLSRWDALRRALVYPKHSTARYTAIPSIAEVLVDSLADTADGAVDSTKSTTANGKTSTKSIATTFTEYSTAASNNAISTNEPLPPTDAANAQTHKTNASKPFYIDNASYFTALLAYQVLAQEQATRILDMCSAPGGKLIALLQYWASGLLSPKQELALEKSTAEDCTPLEVIANEKSKTRFIKLRRALIQYVLQDIADTPLASKLSLQTSCKDACVYGKSPDAFDLVLLDAPCSNDRHVFNNEHELALWSPSRSTQLAKQQVALLCAGIDSCKPNGLVVYLTCSLGMEENEKVIARILKKRAVQTVPPSQYLQENSIALSRCVLETQRHGHSILPDSSFDAGPLYICILRKATSQPRQKPNLMPNANHQ